jgi:hypothetical protein
MKTVHILIPVCMALGGLVWIDNFSGEEPASASARPAPVRAGSGELPAGEAQPKGTVASATLAAGNPLAAVDLQTLGDTVNRPLFAPSRSRPPPVVEAPIEVAAAPPPPPPPSYALLGVVRNAGRAIALLLRVSDGTSFRAEVGDTIGGWRVASVESTAVRLERADGTIDTVQLTDGRKSSPNGAPMGPFTP